MARKRRVRCRGCGELFEKNRKSQTYCSRACGGRRSEKAGVASSPPGEKNPNFRHGLYSQLLLPAGRRVYDARIGQEMDVHAELEQQVVLADAVFAQVSELAQREPAAIPVLTKALAERNSAIKALASYELRRQEASGPSRVNVTVSVREVGGSGDPAPAKAEGTVGE